MPFGDGLSGLVHLEIRSIPGDHRFVRHHAADVAIRQRDRALEKTELSRIEAQIFSALAASLGLIDRSRTPDSSRSRSLSILLITRCPHTPQAFYPLPRRQRYGYQEGISIGFWRGRYRRALTSFIFAVLYRMHFNECDADFALYYRGATKSKDKKGSHQEMNISASRRT